MNKRLNKNRWTSPILGLGIGLLGLLPAYFSLDLFFRFYNDLGNDPSLINFILISGIIALTFFLCGYWVYKNTDHIGLEISITTGQVTFKKTPVIGAQNTETIAWNQVHQLVMTDIPRAGETLYFHDHQQSAQWHRKAFPLKLSESGSQDVFRHFHQSAAAVGLELHQTSRFITFFFDRYVWEIRPQTPHLTQDKLRDPQS